MSITGKVIDWKWSIERVGGRKKAAEDLFHMLIASFPSTLTKLETAYNTQDWEAMRFELDRVQGARFFCSTPRLQEALKQLDACLTSDKQENIEKFYQQLIEEIHAVSDVIKKTKHDFS